jgi:site-specific DNA recombinase
MASFAEHERSQCRERTAAKASAARKRGKWIGGMPVLGFRTDERGGKLLVDEAEAERVRAAFTIYAEKRSLIATAAELNRRGWTSKVFESRAGRRHGGKPFDKVSVSKLLTNPLFVGRIRHKGVEFPGEHEAIVDEATWSMVQAILKSNGRPGVSTQRNRHGAVLKGLARCKPCDAAMSYTSTLKAGRRFGYYLCTAAAKNGWSTCSSKAVPVAELERFVVDKISAIGSDANLQSEVVAQARTLLAAEVEKLKAEAEAVRRELQATRSTLLRRLASTDTGDGEQVDAEPDDDDLGTKVERLEIQAEEVAARLAASRERTIDEREVAAALARFDEVWTALTIAERARLLSLVLERVDYDGGEGTIDLTFRPNGFDVLTARTNENGVEENS